jgi:hypothetical protein
MTPGTKRESTHMSRPETRLALAWRAGCEPIDSELDAFAVLTAPALVLLLADETMRPVRLYKTPAGLLLATGAVLDRGVEHVIPTVIGIVDAFLNAVLQGATPSWLLRFPSLVERTDGAWVLRLPRGSARLSLLVARTATEAPLVVTAQQALTMAFLFAESRVAALLPASLLHLARSAVEGEIALAMDQP